MLLRLNQLLRAVCQSIYMLHAAVPLHHPTPASLTYPSSYVLPWQVMSTGGPGIGQLGLSQTDYSATASHLTPQWPSVPVLGKSGNSSMSSTSFLLLLSCLRLWLVTAQQQEWLTECPRRWVIWSECWCGCQWYGSPCSRLRTPCHARLNSDV